MVQGSGTAMPERRLPHGERSGAGEEAVGPQHPGSLEGAETSLPPATPDATSQPDLPYLADEDLPDLDSMKLISSAMQGDPSANARLFFVLRPMIHRFCRARLAYGQISAVADDVAQEALLAIFTALPRYEIRHGSPFRAFALAIAMRKVVDAQRAAARDRTAPVALPPDRPAPDENPPEHHAIAVEEAMRIRRLLQTLSPQQSAVLSLRIGIGLSANDTAHVLGMSAAAVRVAQHRGLRALRSRLTDQTG
jgi:RNA polymerase sigma-70 factor, ECF subfamily